MQLTTFALIVAAFGFISGIARSQLLPRDEGSMDEDPVLGVEPKNSTIWGPGLAPHVIVLPARYFVIQLIGPGGHRVNSSQQVRDALKVRIDCNGDRQVWTQVLDRKDGSFIVRYKLFQSCLTGFRIIVTFQKKHVGKSPYKIQGPVHPDPCYCPSYELSTWLQKAKCPTPYAQIDKDLSLFNDIDFDQVLRSAIDRFYNPGAHSFCHYVVKNNEIYRKCYGQHVGFHIFPDSILLSLTRKIYIPDLEFIMNLGDWPLVDLTKSDKPPLPIFSWCKTNETGDIVLPTYELMEASLEAMGRVSLDMMTVQTNSEVDWKGKIPKLFWRGRDSRKERLDLITLSKENPDLINASLTNFFFFRDKEEIYGPKAPHISFFKFFDYKYQLNIDGTVAAYRFPFLLGGDSVVLKVDSPYIEYFYGNLKPWRHYIPVQNNLQDLIEKISWAMNHDEQAKVIGEHGRKFAQDHLMPLDVICYHSAVLMEWSKKLKYPVKVRSGMELVTQVDTSRNTVCECKPSPRHSRMVRDKREL